MAGTGKTSTARKMGQVYYDMNLIASAEVVEASATDLMGQYIGQTGPKTQTMLEKALGKVLFIDEAYRLADGKFGQEAMDELVDCLTKPAFFHKLIVILAGYDEHIVELMSSNPGLTSRFPETLQFQPLSSDYCIQLLAGLFKTRKQQLEKNGQVRFDCSALEDPSLDFAAAMSGRFESLAHTSGWANARDVETLAKTIFNKALQSDEEATVSIRESEVLEALAELLKDRSSRRRLPLPLSIRPNTVNEPRFAPMPGVSPPPHVYDNVASASTAAFKLDEKQQSPPNVDSQKYTLGEKRDADVSDEIWHQLQQDKAAALAQEQKLLELRNAHAKQKRVVQGLRDHKVEAPINPDDHAKRLHEHARLRQETERREQEAILARLEREAVAREENRRQEEKKQQKLREMGVCPVGYRWIKSSNGYRCAGGSHWVSDADLA